MNFKFSAKSLISYGLMTIGAIAYLFFRFYFGKDADLIALKNDIISLDALVGVLIGALLAYQFNLKQAQKVVDQEAKTFSRYIFILLYKQFAILQGIGDHFLTDEIKAFFENTPPPDSHLTIQKFAITHLSFSLNQDILGKVLLSENFEQSDNILAVMQYLISAEDSFTKCIDLIDLFNEKFAQAFISRVGNLSVSGSMSSEIFKKEPIELLKTIYKAHKEAMHINELATKHFSDACKQSFKKFKCPKRGEIIELMKLT